MIRRLLCRVGVHRWRVLVYTNPMMLAIHPLAGTLHACSCCGKVRDWRPS